LDNLVYRAGLTPTLPSARQLVNHGHILVNNKRVNIPSFHCLPTQVITVRTTTMTRTAVKESLQQNTQKIPLHLRVNTECRTAVINRWPVRSEIPLDLNELLVVEYYSNRI
jgi:small subunit ribosomal protein S4